MAKSHQVNEALSTVKSFILSKSQLAGEVELPSSKSHSIRAIVFATLATGTSHLEKLLDSPDIEQALKASQHFGAKITYSDGPIEIEGTGGKIHPSQKEIDSGNSGQVLRFMGALAALGNHEVVITGDESIQKNRPVKDLLKALNQLGARAKSVLGNDHAPISIQGPAHHGEASIEDGSDSQPVSALLMLAAFLKGTTILHVKNPGEKPWVDLTLHWFKWMKIPFKNEGYTRYEVQGVDKIDAFAYTVPGDFSSAAFPAAAAFATKSKIKLSNIDLNDIQGDKKFFSALEQMGASFEYHAEKKEMVIDGAQPLHGQVLDINDYVDAITILAVVGCFAEGTTHLKNAAIARKKESDRISSICKELKKMNAEIQETEDGLIIKKSQLKDATCDSHQDHRIALSLAVAALAAEGTTIIQNVECVKKSYPCFLEHMKALGAQIEIK